MLNLSECDYSDIYELLGAECACNEGGVPPCCRCHYVLFVPGHAAPRAKTLRYNTTCVERRVLPLRFNRSGQQALSLGLALGVGGFGDVRVSVGLLGLRHGRGGVRSSSHLWCLPGGDSAAARDFLDDFAGGEEEEDEEDAAAVQREVGGHDAVAEAPANGVPKPQVPRCKVVARRYLVCKIC